MLKSLGFSPLHGLGKIEVSRVPTGAMSPPGASRSQTATESSESDCKAFPSPTSCSPPPPAAYGTDDEDSSTDETYDKPATTTPSSSSTELCLRPAQSLPAQLCSLLTPLDGMPLTAKAMKDLLALVSVKGVSAECPDGPRRVALDPMTVINALLNKARDLDEQLHQQAAKHKDETELLLAQARAHEEKEVLDAELLREIMATLREERKKTQTLSTQLQEKEDEYKANLQAAYRQLETKEYQLNEITNKLRTKEAEFAQHSATRSSTEVEVGFLRQHLQHLQEHAIAEVNLRRSLEKEISTLREAQQDSPSTSSSSCRSRATADAPTPVAWSLDGDSHTPDSLASPSISSPVSPLLPLPMPYSTPMVEPAFEEFVATLRGEEEARLRALEALCDHDHEASAAATAKPPSLPPGLTGNGACEEGFRETPSLSLSASIKPFRPAFHGPGASVNTPPRRAVPRPQEYESFLPVRATSGLSNARPSGHISSPNKTAPRDASNQPPGYFAKRCRWGVLCRNVTCRYTHPPRRVEIGLAGQVTPQHEEEH